MARRKSPRAAARRSGRSQSTASSTTSSRLGRSQYRRRLRLEALEDRRLLAGITVTTLADTVDFNDGVTSLREAIFAANTVPGADTIEFAPALTANGPATILLTQGELKITDSLTIEGPGAELLTVDASGNDPTPNSLWTDNIRGNDGDGSRVFNVDDGLADSSILVSLAGMSVTGADSNDNVSGGGIFSSERLVLSQLVVRDNSAFIDGGGLGSGGTELRVFDSIFRDNYSGSRGGGATIFGGGSGVTIRNSSFTNNHGVSGGGIEASIAGDLEITNSSVTGNIAEAWNLVSGGGGISLYVKDSGNATIHQSLIADNKTVLGTAFGGGGLMVIARGRVLVSESEIENNTSASYGGGISATIQGPNGEITIRSSLISGNSATYGGGIGAYDKSHLHRIRVEDCVIMGNSAIRPRINSRGQGGGLWGGWIAVSGSVIRQNSAFEGGGVFAARDVVIHDSLIDENTASIRGGGVFVDQGPLEISNSTIARNSAAKGGGLWLSGGSLIRESTISGNSAATGGGIYFVQQYLRSAADLVQTTLTGNRATESGHGVFVQSGVFSIDSSIVAGNAKSDEVLGDIAKSASATMLSRYSVIGSNAGSGLPESTIDYPDLNGNLIGGPMHGLIDPLLGPLADNGGFELPDGSRILTHALLPGSPAINAGDLNAVAGEGGVPEFDQRGEPFGRIVGGRMDIGAFEYQTPTDLNLLVDTLVDESDGDYSRGDLSLREAIELANAANFEGVVDTIRFDPALWAAGPATILLTMGELQITDSLMIDGPGADLLIIDASGNDLTPIETNGDGSLVFIVDDGSENSLIEVTIDDLTVAGGDFLYGGGILNVEQLTLSRSAVTGNSSETIGGGVLSLAGTLNVIGSRIANNHAGNYGGGIANFDSSFTLSNSTVTGNLAQSGAGIYTYRGPATIEGSAITNNLASLTHGVGGGLHSARSAVTVRRSTISGNSSHSAGGIYSSAELTLLESNVSGNRAAQDGGGVLSRDELRLERTLVSDNRAGRDGGGIWSKEIVTVNASTIARNVAGRDGGGAWLDAVDGSVQFVQVTISANRAERFGAGLWLNNAFAKVVSLAHSTIAANEVEGGGLGGGVFVFQGPVTLNHAIVAKNYAAAGSDVTGLLGASISARFSLIGDNSNSGLAEARVGMPDVNGNLVGGGVFGFIDPLLGELKYNGGFTPTHALPSPTQFNSFPSPAIDTGDPQAQAGVNGVPTHDQRGTPFVRFADGDRRGGAQIDIGAFESQTSNFPTSPFGDFNRNGRVDAADYSIWRDALGRVVEPYTSADGNGDGIVDALDHAVWVGNFGMQGTGFVPIGNGSAALATAESSLETERGSGQVQIDSSSSVPARIAVFERPLRNHTSSGKLAVRISPLDVAARRDRALEAWWATRGRETESQESRDTVAAKESNSREAIDCAVAEMGRLRLAVRR